MISQRYKVDFSPYRWDMAGDGLERLLSQFVPSCVLRRFIGVILYQCQELYDAVIDLMEQRTLFKAGGENLEALGRIVGEPRAPYSYDDSTWFFSDTAGQGTDQVPAWCVNAPFEAYLPASDPEYQVSILARIKKNHTLTASVPELTGMAEELTGSMVSFAKTGPMQVDLLVPDSIGKNSLALLTRNVTDAIADEQFAMPYPATLNCGNTLIFTPQNFFAADRPGRQACDAASCAVGSVTLSLAH